MLVLLNDYARFTDHVPSLAYVLTARRRIKQYAEKPEPEKRHSPAECIGCKKPAMESNLTGHVWTIAELLA